METGAEYWNEISSIPHEYRDQFITTFTSIFGMLKILESWWCKRFIFIISLGKSPLIQFFKRPFSPLVQITTCLWEVKKVKTFPAISWDSAGQQENVYRCFSTLLFLDWKAGYVMFFSNVHSLGKVLRCSCFFHGNSRISDISLDDEHMMTVKTHWKLGHAARWLRHFMLMPPNAEDEKNWGHGSGGCCVLDTKTMAFVLVKTAGSRCSWREVCFFGGEMFMEIAYQPHPTMAIQMVYGSFWEAKAKEVSEIEKKTHLRLCSFVGFIFAEGFLSSPILPNPIVKHQLVWKIGGVKALIFLGWSHGSNRVKVELIPGVKNPMNLSRKPPWMTPLMRLKQKNRETLTHGQKEGRKIFWNCQTKKPNQLGFFG